MTPISFPRVIEKSWDRMMSLLFWPFSWRKWLSLIFIAALAGAGNQGFNFNSRTSHSRETSSSHQQESTKAEVSNSGTSASGSASAPSPIEKQKAPLHAKKNWAKILLWAIPLTLFGMMLLFYIVWLSSRFRFIWLNAVIQNVSAIRAPWNDYRSCGNSWFKWQVILGAVGMGFILLMIGGLAGAALLVKITSIKWVGGLCFVILILFFILGILAMVGAHVLLHDLTLPIMYFDRSSFPEAVRKLWNIAQPQKHLLIKYLFVKLGLQILLGLVIGLAGLVIGGLLGYGGGLLLAPWIALAKHQWFLWIPVGMIALLGFALLILLDLSLELPGAVIMTCVGLYFLAGLDPQFALPRLEGTS